MCEQATFAELRSAGVLVIYLTNTYLLAWRRFPSSREEQNVNTVCSAGMPKQRGTESARAGPGDQEGRSEKVGQAEGEG